MPCGLGKQKRIKERAAQWYWLTYGYNVKYFVHPSKSHGYIQWDIMQEFRPSEC